VLVDGRFSHLGIVTNGDERLQEKKGGIMLPKKKRACLNHYITATTSARHACYMGVLDQKKKPGLKKLELSSTDLEPSARSPTLNLILYFA